MDWADTGVLDRLSTGWMEDSTDTVDKTGFDVVEIGVHMNMDMNRVDPDKACLNAFLKTLCKHSLKIYPIFFIINHAVFLVNDKYKIFSSAVNSVQRDV